MTLLYVYLASVFFFYFTFAILVLNIYQKIKQRGLLLKHRPIKVRTVAQLFVYSLVPIFNVVLGFVLLFSDMVERQIDIILAEDN